MKQSKLLSQFNRNETILYKYETKEPIRHSQSNDYVIIPSLPSYSKQEFRGVWVCTIWNLDFPKHTCEEEYKNNFIELLNMLEAYNMNVVLFQVRPKNDAFYESKLNPWSRFLTGTEGINPGWDPLTWMITETHKRGMEFHAWFNPYRVFVIDLSVDNFVCKHPDHVLKLKPGEEILNPGLPEVQQFIIDTVVEVAENYDIDGVHFDDYFYPYGRLDASLDINEFNLYNHENLSLDDWRRENVNHVVKTIKAELTKINALQNKAIVLGMSPFGIWANKTSNPLGSNTKSGVESLSELYADSYRWVKEEWIDYIVPQTYFEFTNQNAPYADIVDWWVDLVKDTKVNLFTGQSIYRYIEGGWRSGPWDNPEELKNQLLYNSKFEEVTGSVYFRSNHFKNTESENLKHGQNNLKDLFKYKVLPPIFNNLIVPLVSKPNNFKIEKSGNSNLLTWDIDKNAKAYYIYRYEKDDNITILDISKVIAIIRVDRVENIRFFDEVITNGLKYQYFITAFDKANKESLPSKIIII
jgi:uncharacterized lipoprotein YddW (UPF0748 family)